MFWFGLAIGVPLGMVGLAAYFEIRGFMQWVNRYS